MRLLLLMLLAASMTIATPTAPASAGEPSGVCSNGVGDEVQLVSGDFGLPLWLGVQYGHDTTPKLIITSCYGTAAHDEPKTLGGLNTTRVNGDGVTTSSRSDSNSAIQANASASITPRYTVSPGGASGGQELTFETPVTVCSGVCFVDGDGLATTGVIVGTVSQTAPGSGGVSAAYRVSKLCLMVNGIEVTDCGSSLVLPGATTTGNLPVSAGTGGATPGPCLVSVCIPSIDYLGTSGRQLATIYLPDNTPIPVYGVHTCVYQRDAQTPCPA